jgi:hypothetical protein
MTARVDWNNGLKLATSTPWLYKHSVEVSLLTVLPMIIIVYGSILLPFPNNWAAIVG